MTWTLLAGLAVKGSFVIALAWIAAFALRRRSSAARHIVWTAASAALLVLPLLSLALPAWHHPLADRLLPSDEGVTFHASATAGERPAAANAVPRLPAGTAPASVASAPDPRRVTVMVWLAG